MRHVDNRGHGHVIAVERLETQITIIANIYLLVRSLAREQENFYESLRHIVEELEQKCILHEPNLIILGDFNLPLELGKESHNNNENELERATRSLAECLGAHGLTDCWKSGDDRSTFKTGQSRLDRKMYRFNKGYQENLETVWTFTTSDHCLLKLSLLTAKERSMNVRIVSLPAYLLDNEDAVKMVRERECLKWL